MEAERWTRLDAEIRMSTDATGIVDLRPEQPIAADPQIRRLFEQELSKRGVACRMDEVLSAAVS